MKRLTIILIFSEIKKAVKHEDGDINLLWPVRVQKEDTEEEQVGRTSVGKFLPFNPSDFSRN